MKKKRLTKLIGRIVLGLSTTLYLLGDTYGASPVSPSGKNNSGKQAKASRKPVYKRSRGITADPSTFTPDMPFSEAIDVLRYSTEPPLNIVVLWKDLSDNADIDRNTPIGMNGVSGIPLRRHLELLLISVSAGSLAELGYVVEKGVIFIATKDSLPIRMRTRIYDITDLVSAPANYFFPGPLGPAGYYGMPYGGQGYGAYGRPYGFGGPGFSGRAYGRAYGRPSGGRSYGRAYGSGRYSRYPYGTTGRELGDLVGTLYGPSRRPRRSR